MNILGGYEMNFVEKFKLYWCTMRAVSKFCKNPTNKNYEEAKKLLNKI